MKKLLAILGMTLAVLACNQPPLALPKPRIYPKVIYPEKKFKQFSDNNCPFEMEVPVYFEVEKDKGQNKKEAQYNCWLDLYSKELNSYLHLSYIPFNGRTEFDKLVSDAFEMADKHNIKASNRMESLIDNRKENVYGLVFEIDGPVATPLQFFMTDSTQHFIRGSLYFKSAVNRDSIAPVYEFLKTDVARLIEGFRWE